MNRREFLKGSVLAGAAALSPSSSFPVVAPETAGKLIASAPVLQNAAETSIGVSFAVSADASGWVEYSTAPDMANAIRAFSGGHGLKTVDDKVALVRLTGLKPATKYYYRIGADRIEFKGGYSMKNLGSEACEAIHSFTTLGGTAVGSFCVINDTHGRGPALERVLAKLRERKPSVVVWNGDASNVSETIDDAIGIFIRPHADYPDYAADTPFMFLPGNHDFRGRFNRRLCDLMMFREPTERSPRFHELGRNFVQRLGDVALIGLDTGEDKLDTNPRFAGIFRMQAYRELQAEWLAEAIGSEAVKTAKYKVALCHIPLFSSDPRSNPGDVAPADSDPQYRTNFASWQRTCANLWQPSFEKAGVQLVIAGHTHSFRYDAPTAERPWAQIVGGGPDLGTRTTRNVHGEETTTVRASRFPTVVEGRIKDGRLVVTVHDVWRDAVAGEYVF